MRVFLWLMLLFPLLELAVLIKLGSVVGVFTVLMMIIGSGLLGVMCLRVAGIATAMRARERLAQGQMPEREMFDGLIMACAGGLLIFPGVISDLIAAVLLFPLTRHWLIQRWERKAQEQALRQRAFAEEFAARQSEPTASGQGNVIEGEFERRDQ